MNYKQITKTMIVCSLGLFATMSFAQSEENMVPNGSFESIEKAPKKLGSIESATGWVSPTGVRADLFVGDAKVEDIGVPSNVYGKEEAKDGDNYAGIVGYSYGDKMPRSYVMNKLSVPMKKGMKYCVEMYVSMAEASKYASNQIGVNFSNKPYGTDSKTSIIDEMHVVHDKNKVFNAPFGWEKICGVYEAKGGEKFIAIGNFVANEDTKNERNKASKDVKVSQIIAAYYYIDNISVRLIDKNTVCDCDVADEDDGYSKTVYHKAVVLDDKMTVNQKIEAHNVNFAFGKDQISSNGEAALDFIAEQMKANTSLKLQVKGHSDKMEEQVGEEKSKYANMDSKRVNAVIMYLMDKGIEESRLIASPQGAEAPSVEVLTSDEDDIKQAKNRRVEFKVR